MIKLTHDNIKFGLTVTLVTSDTLYMYGVVSKPSPTFWDKNASYVCKLNINSTVLTENTQQNEYSITNAELDGNAAWWVLDISENKNLLKFTRYEILE